MRLEPGRLAGAREKQKQLGSEAEVNKKGICMQSIKQQTVQFLE